MRRNRLRWMLPLMGGGAQTWQSQLLALFPAGDDVGMLYNVVSTTTSIYVYQHINQNRYMRVNIGPANVAVGENGAIISYMIVSKLYKGYNTLTTPATTYSGFTLANNTAYPGGQLHTSVGTAGHYVQVVTSACTTVGAICSAAAADKGVALVTIDGDNTLADLLPTAQDLVTEGTLSDTVLVANGGSLNPTDRVWNQYNITGNYDDWGNNVALVLFTESLSSAAHTVKITATGYKQGESSNIKLHVYGIIATGTATRASDDGYDVLVDETNIATSVNEFAHYVIPTGAAEAEWIGHEGSLKCAVPPAITVDGVEQTEADNLNTSGSEIVITLQHALRHTGIDAGGTDIGTADVTYTMNKLTGLTISYTITWALGGINRTGYPCMLNTYQAAFDRYKTYDQEAAALTADDNSVNLNTDTGAAWCWKSDGNYAAVMYIPDLLTTVGNWANADPLMMLWWQDRSGGTSNKAYAQRYTGVDPWTAYDAEDVIQSECNYRIGYYPDGADSVFAGKF